MIDFTSTPIILTLMLGAVGVIIPVISVVRKEKNDSLYGGIAFGALAAAMAFVVYQIISKHVTPAAIFSKGVLSNDMFGSFFAVVMLIVGIMTTVGSFNYMRGRANPAVYYSLIILSSIGMVLIAYSTDLVMLFVAWELMSIPTYVLAGFNKKDPSSNEAAIKYFLFGALSSGIILWGISIAYGLTGSTNIEQVIAGFSHLSPDMIPLAILAVGMFIAGFGFKMGLVPFHMWIPDTYEGAPPPISALLAAGTKKAGFAAALRVIIMGSIALNLNWSLALAVLAIVTMTFGNLAAIRQKNLPRMLAYSTIAHAGYILIGLSIASFSVIGVAAALFHILNHAVMTAAAFIAVTGIVMTLSITHIDKLRGLGKRMPITSLGLAISLLALAGVPPLNGFWSKLMLFGAAINAGSSVSWAPYLAVAGVLNSALSLAYYVWIIRKMYFEEGESDKRVKEPKSIIAVMIFSVIFMVGVGVYPGPFIEFAKSAVPVLANLSTIH
jgi:proton-translocating NADH-quinone oxidoreductase chain N